MRRDDICLCVSPASRARLAALIADRNTPSKVVWRAEIVLATADGCGTNEIMRRTAWLARHKRFKLHFTPTSASWLNLVERFFGEITRKRIRRGVFTSVADLEAAIHDYLDHHNANPKPFVWTKTAAVVLAKERRPSMLSKQSKMGINRQTRNTSGPGPDEVRARQIPGATRRRCVR
jgi:hypothetical protein